MVVFTRGSDVAAMMLLYKKMAMEMAEDLSKIARAADEGVSASVSLLEACPRAGAASASGRIRVPTSQRMPNSV